MFESQKLLERSDYIEKLERYLDKPLIKVLVGMRRVGKSSLMKILIERLIGKGLPEKNIVYINKESLEFDQIRNYKDLHSYIGQKGTGVQNPVS